MLTGATFSVAPFRLTFRLGQLVGERVSDYPISNRTTRLMFYACVYLTLIVKTQCAFYQHHAGLPVMVARFVMPLADTNR